MTWKPSNLNEAIVYAKGWNDAVQAAAKVAENFARRDRPYAVTICDLAATEIRKLDRSMQACDD